jgi:hypothetical protein
MGCYAEYQGFWFPTFRSNVSPMSSRAKASKTLLLSIITRKSKFSALCFFRYHYEHQHPRFLLYSSSAGSQKITGLSPDQALLIHCSADNYTACIQYYCFLH